MFWTHSALRENAVVTVTLKAREESVIKFLSTLKTDDFHPMLGLTGASNSAASAKQLPGGVRPGGMVEPGYLLVSAGCGSLVQV